MFGLLNSSWSSAHTAWILEGIQVWARAKLCSSKSMMVRTWSPCVDTWVANLLLIKMVLLFCSSPIWNFRVAKWMLLKLQGIKCRLDRAEILWNSLLALILVVVLLQQLNLALLGHLLITWYVIVYKVFKLDFICCGLSLLPSFLLL